MKQCSYQGFQGERSKWCNHPEAMDYGHRWCVGDNRCPHIKHKKSLKDFEGLWLGLGFGFGIPAFLGLCVMPFILMEATGNGLYLFTGILPCAFIAILLIGSINGGSG